MRVYLNRGGFQPPDCGNHGGEKPPLRDDFTCRSPYVAAALPAIDASGILQGLSSRRKQSRVGVTIEILAC